jgi:plastocyanin
MKSALLGAACLLLAACSAPPNNPTTSAPAAQASGSSKTATVDLPPSYLFAPASIEVKPGTTITWTNHDNFTHSVQVQGQPAGVDSNVHMMSPGQSTQITFDKPGTYQYVCTLHAQNMKGTVVVDSA